MKAFGGGLKLARWGGAPKLGVFSRSAAETTAFFDFAAEAGERTGAQLRLTAPDARLQQLAGLFPAAKVTPTALTLHDMSTFWGEGADGNYLLSRTFLSEMAGFDGFLFASAAAAELPDDLEMLRQDLLQRDKEMVERRLGDARRRLAKATSDGYRAVVEVLEECERRLGQGRAVAEGEWSDEAARQLNELNLLSAKPLLPVVFGPSAAACPPDAVKLPTPADLPALVEAVRHLMMLITFFTVGEDDVRGWPLRQGTPATKAAAVIHSDFEQRLISAEVCPLDRLVEAGSEEKARAAGRLRAQSKQYIVEDGDVVTFKLGPKKGR